MNKSRLPYLIVGVVIVVAGIAAILASGNDSSDKTTTTKVAQKASITGAALPDFTQTVNDPAIGQTAPIIRGKNFDGESSAITNDGHSKVVIFLAHWCPHCQKEFPLISKFVNDKKVPAGVEVIAVATGINPDYPNYPPSAWFAREHWSAPVIVDNDNSFANAYGLTSYPYFVVLDGNGKVVIRSSGEIGAVGFAALVKKADQAP